jgi:D-sedoheptulose 7-phosphate isomerase
MLSLQRTSGIGWIDRYADTLGGVLKAAIGSDRAGQPLGVDNIIDWAAQEARRAHDRGNKLIFIGNGGSAAIASHMATDYSKNGTLRSVAFNDGSMLTCLGNDYGYEHVFAKQVEFHGRPGDLLVAISSSGKSANILNATTTAREIGCTILTLSGFRPDNPLRNLGDRNLFLQSGLYGFVEIGHLTLCHAILDYSMECDGRGPAGLKS